MTETSDDWHSHRLLVTETLERLEDRAERQEQILSDLRSSISELKVKVALISSAVSMSGTYILNWIVEHRK